MPSTARFVPKVFTRPWASTASTAFDSDGAASIAPVLVRADGRAGAGVSYVIGLLQHYGGSKHSVSTCLGLYSLRMTTNDDDLSVEAILEALEAAHAGEEPVVVAACVSARSTALVSESPTWRRRYFSRRASTT